MTYYNTSSIKIYLDNENPPIPLSDSTGSIYEEVWFKPFHLFLKHDVTVHFGTLC